MKIPFFVKSVLFGVPVGVTILDLFGYVARVDGISMQPALNPNREITDYVFLNRWAVRSLELERGEIISLVSPKDPDLKIIKRVVGVQGDIVRTLGYKREVLRIPEGHCWVEGDHTGHSLDSNNFGPVSLGLVVAKASYIVWPPSRWQCIKRSLPDSRIPINITANFNGNVLRRALTLGDVDNDGSNELIVGSESGEVVIFKGQDKWLSVKDVNSVTCVAVGDILNIKKNCLVVITGDGWCYIYCCIKQTCLTDSSETQLDEGVDQVDGQVFSTNDSVDSERSAGTDSCANTSAGKEKNVLKRLHMQRIPANSKDILLGDIDGDGAIELVLGLTDRVVRSYRWCNTPMEFGLDDDAVTSQGVFENISGKLVGLNKWECAKQIGSVTLHNSHDGSPSLLVAQPGGTFMRIICPDDAISQSSESGAANRDSESSQSDSLLVSKIDYQSLGISRMRNQNISTEILGNLEFKSWQGYDCSVSDDSENSGLDSNSCSSNHQRPMKSKEKPYVIATLDGTIMLVQNQNILWSIAVDHQIFAVSKLDVTGNGSDDIIACCWDGQTYILDQNKHSVRFHLNEAVQAFECGYYNLEEDSPPVTCFIYVTFRNKIYLYYDIPLKEITINRFKPNLTNLKELFVENFEHDKFDKHCQKELVEYLLYGVKK